MASVDVGNLVAKLIPLLNDEVMLLTDVRNKIEAVRKELSLIQEYLKDADAKAEMGSLAVKEWVKQLRQAAFGIQDAVDLYLFTVAPKRSQRQRHRSVGMLSKICFVMRTVVPRHKFTRDIVNIMASVRRLEEQKETLGLSPSVASTPTGRVHLDLRHVDLKEDELVGVDYAKSLLNRWLINRESKRTVIAVVGEGGLGKTTIVKNVYKKYKENKSFECCAWIPVSRSFQMEHLPKTLLQSLYENDDKKYATKKNREEVMDKATFTEIREYLEGKNYMIVFDDVWEEDFGRVIQFALPDNRNRLCRIIITTRDKRVAEFCRSSSDVCIHELEPLQAEDALNLFLLKTFKFDPCPEDLNDLSKSFVKKCEGVPLAIVAISGVLSTKGENVSEWQKVYDSLRSKLSSDPHLKGFYQVLSESYYDLPYHLKLCLLYFGLFSEGYTITRPRLIHLWVAEGFVNENELYENQTLEEAAEEYLAELIGRCLVKVFNFTIDGRVKSIRVHDLMHNFISKKCDELNFCQVAKGQQFRLHEWTRRLSIHEDVVIEKDKNYGRVRSCIVSDIKQPRNSTLNSLLSCLKLLVTLDFENSALDHLPEAMGNLLNLKYLSVRNTKIKTIPKFIGNLQKLETLNLKDTHVCELPVEINRLVKLRHLLSYSRDSSAQWTYVNGMKLKEGIGSLTALQSLSMIDAIDGNAVIREMENLKNMRRLVITNLSRDNGNTLCNAIKNMPHLRTLEIKAAEEHVLELQSLVDFPANIRLLHLFGRLARLPEWIPKLKHLVELGLSGSRLAEDPLPSLKGLPELLGLSLANSSQCEELYFKSEWFMKLRYLRLQDMDGLRTLKIDKGALPNLENLVLRRIPQMVKMPNDIQNLEALKHLYYSDVPIQFVDDILIEWGEKNTKLRVFK